VRFPWRYLIVAATLMAGALLLVACGGEGEEEAAGTGASSGGFEIRNTSDYVARRGTQPVLYVLGEVVNNTASNAAFVRINGTFLDAGGNVVETDFTYSCVEVLGPGDDSPFSIGLPDPSPDIAGYRLSVEGDATSEPVLSDLDISGVTTELVSLDGLETFHVRGLLTNNSNTTYDFVEVCCALYNAAGDVIRRSTSFAKPRMLAPGESGTFDCLRIVDGTPVASHRLWVRGARE